MVVFADRARVVHALQLEGPMTHVPPQFRMPSVLIDEWRRRADRCRMSDPTAADAYERCADELCELDVHTEAATDGSRLYASRMETMAPWLAAGALGIGVLGFARAVTHRQRRPFRLMVSRMAPDNHDVTPPHGDKLLRSTGRA